MSKAGVKLAPIFEKNFSFNKASTKSKKKSKKRKSSQEKQRVSSIITAKSCDEVLVLSVDDDGDDSLTDIYFTEGEEEEFCKKQKVSLPSQLEVSEVFDEVARDGAKLLPSELWTKKYEQISVTSTFYDEQLQELKTWLQNWTCSPSSQDEDESVLPECILLSGAPGIGKTSMVYKAASDLKFKVFEVNCSSIRNGRTIMEQLKEATLSQVINRSRSSDECDWSHEQKGSSNSTVSFSKVQTDDVPLSQNGLSFSSSSLILFDDVDVQLEEDEGFWKAITSLLSARTPLVLTATQRIWEIQSNIENVKILKIEPPSVSSLADHLSHLLNGEGVSDARLPKDFSLQLLSDKSCDIRRCINQLQFNEKAFAHRPCKGSEESDDSQLFSKAHYEYGLVSDLLQSKFKLKSSAHNRDLFMKSIPPSPSDESFKTWLLRDLLIALNNTEKIRRRCGQNSLWNKESIVSPSKALISSSLEEQLSCCFNNLTLSDYVPYLSLMCEFEQNRFRSLLPDSRRSRRFHHYLDSVCLFIDDTTRQNLILAYADF